MDKKQMLTTAFIAVLLSSALVGLQSVRLAEANFMPMQIPQPAFIIKSDGSVDPSTAPIQRDGNVYTFTDDIVGYTIAFELDNVVIDGGGYSLIGNGNSTGILILNRNGITVRNMKVSNFFYGIKLIADIYMGATSSSNNLSDNILTNNEYGIFISSSSSNVLRNNIMNNNTRNFGVQGKYAQDVDVSNTVDGKPIIFWVNQHDWTVPSGAGYIALINCTNVTVRHFTLVDNGQGIVLVYTTNSVIDENYVSNTDSGIYIQDSSGNTISGNNLTRNGDGIRGQASSNNSMSSNYITNNEHGIYFTGAAQNNVISGNTVAANTVDGIHLWASRNTDVGGNTITSNTENGINFFDCRDNRIFGNTITGNGNGIKFWYDTSNNVVSENYIAQNSLGILIDDSFDNSIIGNMITENNGWGMRLTGSQNNIRIYHNSFVDNHVEEGLQVSIPGQWPLETLPGRGNVWDNGTAGNYWSDYITRYPNASETGSSEIGDIQFYINENNFDRYPLMNPVTIPEFPSWALLLVLMVAVMLVTIVYKRNMKQHSRGGSDAI